MGEKDSTIGPKSSILRILHEYKNINKKLASITKRRLKGALAQPDHVEDKKKASSKALKS